ncbi:MAG: hypothetical protein K0U66_02980 [Gammaproteobacteria bacterium]|nr:hypothetical protein [Gammaproteobacteria bacterium]
MELSSIINDVKSTLCSEGFIANKQGSHFQKLLGDSENQLLQLFSGAEIPKESDEKLQDLLIKFLAINALYSLIQNSPEYGGENFDAHEEFSEKLAHSIFELAVIRFVHSKDWATLYYMVAYAALANKLTLLDIKSCIATLSQPATIFDRLIEFMCIIFIPAHTTEDLRQRNLMLGLIKHEFCQMQDGVALDKAQNYLEIVALSNIVDVLEVINLYLAEGVGENISSLIDNSIANAVTVFSMDKNREWELIANLLRFALRKLHSDSVWTYANSSSCRS